MAFGNRASPTLSRRKQALRYARRGWRVLPLFTASDGRCSCAAGQSCDHPGKHPRTRNGVKDATTDERSLKPGGKDGQTPTSASPPGSRPVSWSSMSMATSARRVWRSCKRNTAGFQRRSRSKPARDATAIFVAVMLGLGTPSAALAKESMSGATAAMWSPLGASTFREPTTVLSMGEGWTRSR